MKNLWLTTMCLSLGLGLAAVGCGDDESDDDSDVSIMAPGVDVKADSLTLPEEGAAGSPAIEE